MVRTLPKPEKPVEQLPEQQPPAPEKQHILKYAVSMLVLIFVFCLVLFLFNKQVLKHAHGSVK